MSGGHDIHIEIEGRTCPVDMLNATTPDNTEIRDFFAKKEGSFTVDVSLDENKFIYYMNRKGKYFFRNNIGILTLTTYQPKEIQSLKLMKYRDIVKVETE